MTAELIESDGVNLVIAQGAPETTNPVADQCELSEMPCITTMCPWQPWFFGRNGDPAKGFDYTYHYFWGLEDVIANFLDMWDATGLTSKNIAGLFPNDADGNAWGDPELGLPKPLLERGYTVIDPGRYQVMNNDFSSQIAAFKEAGCEIVTGNMIPPDFATFWSAGQAAELQPQGGDHRQGAFVPVLPGKPWRGGRRALDRGLVVLVAPLQVQPDRAVVQGSDRRLHRRHRQTLDADRWLQPLDLRGRRRCGQTRRSTG